MKPDSNLLVRPSAIAGEWYPGSAAVLRRTIEDYLARVSPVTLPGPLLALVSPHAGYAYSGQTAAHAYAQLRGASFSRVILLGPLHRPIYGSKLGPFMAPQEHAYRTPLGDVPLDREFLDRLDKSAGLTWVRHDEEHSLEIELPFLQVVLPQFSLVPLMLGDYIADPGTPARLEKLASALVKLWTPDTLIVVSTDLTHLADYDAVVRIDRRLAQLVAAFDVTRLTEELAAERVHACGATGLVAAFRAAAKLGAKGVRVLAQTTSGDVTGKREPGAYTVGYLAAAVYG